MLQLLPLILISAALSFSVAYGTIVFSKSLKIGQQVREEAPGSHKSKSGTPSFGGVAIFTSLFVCAGVFIDIDTNMLLALAAVLAFCLMGLADDLIKIMKTRNLGLTSKQKILLQIAAALMFAFFIVLSGHNESVKGLARLTGFSFPVLYFVLSSFMLVASSNAANLTDGLDGLLGGVSLAAFISFMFISLKTGEGDIAGLCAIAIGSIAGFLVLNLHPAKIFMGDTGSLGIGALLACIAVLLHKEFLLVLVGGVFVIETASVILQVSYFKRTGRRIFRMSPLHHHFEMSGMKETAVVSMFWAAAVVFAVAGYMIR